MNELERLFSSCSSSERRAIIKAISVMDDFFCQQCARMARETLPDHNDYSRGVVTGYAYSSELMQGAIRDLRSLQFSEEPGPRMGGE